MVDLEKLFDDCEALLAKGLGMAKRVIESTHFDKRNPQHLSVICLYLRIFDLACNIKALLEAKAYFGVAVLFRGQLEASWDLINAIQDKSYSKSMLASFLGQQVKLSKAALNNPHHPVSKLAAGMNVAAQLSRAEGELSSLQSGGIVPLSVADRARKAAKMDEYQSAYFHACLQTHNNIASLEEWYIDKTAPEFQLKLGRDRTDILKYVAASLGIVLVSARDVESFFSVSKVEGAELFAEFERIQTEMYKACFPS